MALFPPRHFTPAHGGLTPEGELPDDTSLDLSVNINPYAPHPELVASVRAQPFDQYPDPHQTELRKKLAQSLHCTRDELLIGNGANELFWALARAFLGPEESWLAVEPNYSEFSRAAARCRAKKIVFTAEAAHQFRWSTTDLAKVIEQAAPRLLMLSNPCSPTGFYKNQGPLEELAEAFPDTLFCWDQSFLSLSQHWQDGLDWPRKSNILCFRSLTKDFGIAGVRLGLVLGPKNILAEIQQEIPTWSVNSFASAAGLWIAEAGLILAEDRQKILRDHATLEAELTSRGLEFIPSSTVFTMIRPPDALALAEQLWLKYRILVRSCASYGHPDWLRIAAKPEARMQRFWQALDKEIT